MRRIREVLRLHLQAGLSYTEVGRALKVSKSVVGKYVSLARAASVDWAGAQSLSDEDLDARLFRPALPRSSHQLAPDFALVHQELKRPGVTLILLWEEYARGNPLAYKYSSFCIKYREFARTQQRSMRQIHIAGEKLFVDYAGSTVPVINPGTVPWPFAPRCSRRHLNSRFALMPPSRAIPDTDAPGRRLRSINSRLSAGLCSRRRRLACVDCSDMVCTEGLVHTIPGTHDPVDRAHSPSAEQ